MMDFFEFGYLGLFVVCFLSATILPLTSEGVLLGFLFAGYDPVLSLIISSIGNILGGSTNYWLGRLGKPSWLEKIGVSQEKILRFELKIKRYGFGLAFLSWLPFVGDPLLVALGFFRAPWWLVFMLMSIGKFIRYLILILPWLF